MEEVQREGNLGKRRHEILENTHTMKRKRQLNHFLTLLMKPHECKVFISTNTRKYTVHTVNMFFYVDYLIERRIKLF